MKQNSHGFLLSLLLAFLLFSHSQSVSARFLVFKQGAQTQKKLELGIPQPDSSTDFADIMGGREEKEEEEEEEEWAKRKMMEEAHLDYVYTQNEKP